MRGAVSKYAFLVIAVLLAVQFPVFAGDNARQPEATTAAQRTTLNDDPNAEWLYWQQHYDDIEAADVASRQPVDGRGIASEIEGCKMPQKVELYQTVYCKQDPPLHAWDNDVHVFCRTTGAYPYQDNYGYSTWSTWVPKETGQKCYTIGATIDISTFLQSAHAPSTSMQLWLEQQLNAPPGGYTYPGGYNFTSYEQPLSGTSSCSSSSTTQTWTTNVGLGYSYPHQVKIWSVNQSGSGCDPTVTITP